MNTQDDKILKEMYAKISALSPIQLEQLAFETVLAWLSGEISEAQGAVIMDMITESVMERLAAQEIVSAGVTIN
jgi:hypothetical protein